jgi:hypothetical protein
MGDERMNRTTKVLTLKCMYDLHINLLEMTDEEIARFRSQNAELISKLIRKLEG